MSHLSICLSPMTFSLPCSKVVKSGSYRCIFMYQKIFGKSKIWINYSWRKKKKIHTFNILLKKFFTKCSLFWRRIGFVHSLPGIWPHSQLGKGCGICGKSFLKQEIWRLILVWILWQSISRRQNIFESCESCRKSFEMVYCKALHRFCILE